MGKGYNHQMKIYVLGICGTFMGGLAQLAAEKGIKVSGCDENVYPPMDQVLLSNGITIDEGYNPKKLPKDVDLVVVGNVIARGNPMIEEILNKGIDFISGPEFLSKYLLAKRHVVAISGTHGKTSVSSMVTKVLLDNGVDCGYLIAGRAKDLDATASLGTHEFFVIEADEYDTAFFDKRSKFIHYSSDTLIINNLEFDHADIFDDISAIQKQFHHLVRTIPSDGNIIIPKECEAIEAFMEQGCWSNKHYFGEGTDELWRYQLIETDGSKFKIIYDGSNQTEEANVEWRHSGLHNVTNAIAATMAAHTIGISVNQACAALSDFIGVKRRMEVIYSDCNVTVYDDFAHHPTAIKTTLEGLRAKVGSEFILAIIEPRSATMRMGVHGRNLASSVLSADQVMWYQNSSVDWDMADLLQDASLSSSVVNDLEKLIEMTTSSIQEKTHIVIMSNGGFEGFHRKLLKSFDHN